MGTHSDFLSGAAGHEKREYRRRNVRLQAILLYLRKGLRGCMSQRALALNLSEGGCMITCPRPDIVSDHLYVVIAGIRTKIACAVVGRSETRLNLRFGNKLPTDVVDHVAGPPA